MSTVMRGAERQRPDWEYPEQKERERSNTVTRLDILEMLESIRNTLEEIRDRLPEKSKADTGVAA